MVMDPQGDLQEVIQEIDLHQEGLQGMVLHLIEDHMEVVDLVEDHLQVTTVVQDLGLLMKSIHVEEKDTMIHMKENADQRLSRDRLTGTGAEVLCKENHQAFPEPELQKDILQTILILEGLPQERPEVLLQGIHEVLHQGSLEVLHQGMSMKEGERMKEDSLEMEAEEGEEEVEDMIILQVLEEVIKEEAMMDIANISVMSATLKIIFDHL